MELKQALRDEMEWQSLVLIVPFMELKPKSYIHINKQLSLS